MAHARVSLDASMGATLSQEDECAYAQEDYAMTDAQKHEQLVDTMHALTSLGRWPIEDMKRSPELYRSYVRELAVCLCAVLTDTAEHWPNEWTYTDIESSRITHT